MSWKDKVDSVNSRVKQGARNLGHNAAQKIKAGTTDFVKDQVKSDWEESGVYRSIENKKDKVAREKEKVHAAIDTHKDYMDALRNTKALKGKAKVKAIVKASEQAAVGQFGNTDIGKKFKAMFEKIKKLVVFIADNIKVIAIVSLIVTLGSFITIFSISLAQSFGRSPHYYCEVDPEDWVVDTEFYKQYCERNPNSFKLETMNGHYIVQDGDNVELEKSCAIHNMLLRFFCMNDANWYDCIFDATGKYPQEPLIKLNFQSQGDLRQYINGFSTDKSNVSTKYNSSSHGAKSFASEQGISGWNYGTWGYLRDNSLNFSYKVDSYKNNASSEQWVWDISHENLCWDVPTLENQLNIYADSNWAFRGGDVNIKYIPATDDTIRDGYDLLNLILGDHVYNKHPEGVVVFTSTDAILVTGYDSKSKSFLCIDSSLGLAGGFEGPVSNDNFHKGNITHDMLMTYQGTDIIGCFVIEASFENIGNVTMGVTDGRALGNAYSYPANTDPNREVIFGAPPTSIGKDAAEYATAACVLTWTADKHRSDVSCNSSNSSTCSGTTHRIQYDWIGESPSSPEFDDAPSAQASHTRALAWNSSKAGDPYAFNKSYDCIGLCHVAIYYASKGKCEIGTGTSGWYRSLPYSGCCIYVPVEEMQAGDIILKSNTNGQEPTPMYHALMYIGEGKIAEAAGWSCGGLKVRELTSTDYSQIGCVIRVYLPGEVPA